MVVHRPLFHLSTDCGSVLLLCNSRTPQTKSDSVHTLPFSNGGVRQMCMKPMLLVFEERSDGCRSFDLRCARNSQRAHTRSRGQVMARMAPLWLLRPAGVHAPESSLSCNSGPRWRSQKVKDIHRNCIVQVLPGLLSCYVPQLHIGLELVNQ